MPNSQKLFFMVLFNSYSIFFPEKLKTLIKLQISKFGIDESFELSRSHGFEVLQSQFLTIPRSHIHFGVIDYQGCHNIFLAGKAAKVAAKSPPALPATFYFVKTGKTEVFLVLPLMAALTINIILSWVK